jgi:hypothetical protein
MAIRTQQDLIHDLMGCRGEGRIGELFTEAVAEIWRIQQLNEDTVKRLSERMGRMELALRWLDHAVTGLLDETPKNVLKTMNPVVLRTVDQALRKARDVVP